MIEALIIFLFVLSFFSKRTVFLKDISEVITSTSFIFFIILYAGLSYQIKIKDMLLHLPSSLAETLIFVLPAYKPFYIIASTILFLTLLAGSLIDNRFHILKALFSVFVKLFAGFFTFVFFLPLLTKMQVDSFKNFCITMIILTVFYFIPIVSLSKNRETFENRFRIGNEYIYSGKIFLTGGLLGSLYLLLRGFPLSIILKIIVSSLLFYWIFRYIFKRTVKTYIRDLIERLDEDAEQYMIRVFSSFEIKGPNAFAYYKGNKKAIGITEDFVKRFDSNEINFAIAHELAHHRKNHAIIRVWSEILSRAGLSLIFWMFKISSLPSFLISSLVHLTKKALYKSEEEEADLLAIEALKKAGLSQRGGETFFLKLLRYNPVRKGFLRRVVNIVLEDHPLPEKRLEKVRGLIEF